MSDDVKKRHELYGIIIVLQIIVMFIIAAFQVGKEIGYKDGYKICEIDRRSEWYAVGFEDGYKYGYEDCYEGRSYDEFHMIDKMK